jgi:Tol biopolymer transport system component
MRANRRVIGLLAPLCAIGAAVCVAPAALASGMNGKIAFVINPDGADDEISVMNSDGSNPVQITNNSVADNDPAYSPDGTQIAFARQNGVQYDIWVMNADGSGERPIVASASSERYPSWSPDGNSIVYTRTLRGGGRDIWTARADGTNARSIISTPGFDSEPAWSPVGNKIAFVHADSGAAPDLAREPGWLRGSPDHERREQPLPVVLA